MRYPAYPKYKPSGIEWLGKVPEHWELKRLRYLITRLDQGWSPNADSSPAEEEQWGVLKLSAVRDGRFEPSENKALDDVPDNVPLVTPEEGDVLISRSNTPERVGDACLVLQDYPRLIVPDLLYRVKLASDNASPAYVCAFLLSRSGRAQIEGDARGSSGSMVKLGQGHVRAWLVPWPPLAEQRAITEFLDGQTARLQKLVAKKLALIETLKEKRTTLISRTVTRGLPPDAARAAGLEPHCKLEPTGLHWLGEVPESWDIVRLKFVVPRIEQGWSPDCHGHAASEEEWGVLKAGCCNNGRFHPEENKALPIDIEPLPALEVQPGDVLMSRASGSEVLIGSSAVVPPNCRRRLLLSDKIYRLRIDTGAVVPSYLAYLLQCPVGRFQIRQVISGASGLAKNIAQGDVKNFVLPIPPLAEQRAIVDFLGHETAAIDQMIARVETAIDRLQEYRVALITAAVTGKIDVREVAA